ncbi:hypothetical protein CONCODRAFT_6787 [Conidiobolus coronatus NRRL 28638]|uniref:F-box domain-containing protein n=1 Tax=Conidiobolus coronatus (strain ATCC 28846 / CBS 209.66 / NRRL 28638) TaxID=796925 RepID=A0A137P6J2_CONC2|nr:hypothetical protein CONCODRAFT_6787 [Conidiobolus coronatus NRRL 28638]|eukprot:KXN70622.1 hypothetical protein CONCODRAFT_6787 [Conidiobolus coronatus NRRL 28638]
MEKEINNNSDEVDNDIKLIIDKINKFNIQEKASFLNELVTNSSPHEAYLLQKALNTQNKGNLNLIELLPTDLSLLIFEYLSGDSLLNSLLTCRTWYTKLQGESFWLKKYYSLLLEGEGDPLGDWENSNANKETIEGSKLTNFRKYLSLLSRQKNWSLGKPCRTSTLILPTALDKTMLLGPSKLLIMGNNREIKLISLIERWSIITWKLPQLSIILDIDWDQGLLLSCPFGRETQIFNLNNGELLGTLIGHTSLVTNVVNVFGFIKVLELEKLEFIQVFHPLNWSQTSIEEVENNQFKHFDILNHTLILTQSTLIFHIKFNSLTNLLELVKVKLHSSIIRCISLNQMGLKIQ